MLHHAGSGRRILHFLLEIASAISCLQTSVGDVKKKQRKCYRARIKHLLIYSFPLSMATLLEIASVRKVKLGSCLFTTLLGR